MEQIIKDLLERIKVLEDKVSENEIDISELHIKLYNLEMMGTSRGYYHRWYPMESYAKEGISMDDPSHAAGVKFKLNKKEDE